MNKSEKAPYPRFQRNSTGNRVKNATPLSLTRHSFLCLVVALKC